MVSRLVSAVGNEPRKPMVQIGRPMRLTRSENSKVHMSAEALSHWKSMIIHGSLPRDIVWGSSKKTFSVSANALLMLSQQKPLPNAERSDSSRSPQSSSAAPVRFSITRNLSAIMAARCQLLLSLTQSQSKQRLIPRRLNLLTRRRTIIPTAPTLKLLHEPRSEPE